MLIDLTELSANAAYHALIQSVIPRPIAWVLSENAGGNYNLAPFSFFNVVCADPPLLVISIGHKPDGSLKDTRANVLAREHFVVHIAHREMAKAVTASSATLPAEISEVEQLGLRTVPFEGFPLPRLADCRVALGCRLAEIREIGRAKQGLLMAEIERLYIDDAVVEHDAKGRLSINAAKIDPLGRLGGGQYTSLGEIIDIARPA
jgi:flavin reductase (DIM6/NTAB) family NADH-FMN oxidoreductase RutF